MRCYRIWCPDQGDTEFSGRLVEAYYAEEAVERWASIDDNESAEYSIAGGHSTDVVVLDIEAGTRSTWRVTGESVPSYHARQI